MSVLVTASRAVALRQAESLKRFGASPLVEPAIEIHPLPLGLLDSALDRIQEYSDLLVTSSTTALILGESFRRLHIEPKRTAHLRVAAIGRATAASVTRQTGLTVTTIPNHEDAEGLVAALGDPAERRFLYPVAANRRGVIEQSLGERVETIPVYETRPRSLAHLSPLISDGSLDVVLFSSASAVRSFFASLTGLVDRPILEGLRFVAIGAPTAAAIRSCGFDGILAPGASPEDLARAAGLDPSGSSSLGGAAALSGPK